MEINEDMKTTMQYCDEDNSKMNVDTEEFIPNFKDGQYFDMRYDITTNKNVTVNDEDFSSESEDYNNQST